MPPKRTLVNKQLDSSDTESSSESSAESSAESASESSSESSAESSSESSEYTSESSCDAESSNGAEVASEKIKVGYRLSKSSGEPVTYIKNIPNIYSLSKLAKALGKVYKCKTRIRIQDAAEFIELKGNVVRNVCDFLIKVDITNRNNIKVVNS